jgi:hypothetical protein
MPSLQVRASLNTRDDVEAHTIVHFVTNRARSLLERPNGTISSILEDELRGKFGSDLDVVYVDHHGELVIPEYADSFIIKVTDQYRVPIQ